MRADLLHSLLILVLLSSTAHAAVWRYPVAALSDKKHIFLISQSTPQDLELLLFDLDTNTSEKILSTRYVPAGVRLLPDETRFSFIDDGVVCIKHLDRRAVHTIEQEEPIYGIEHINWLDNEHCYLHARKGERSGIYIMDSDGAVISLLEDARKDYLFPHIIDDRLFCIVRERRPDELLRYGISVAPCRNFAVTDHAEQIITIEDRSLVLLHMCSSVRGYVLGYSQTRDAQSELFSLDCYQFSRVNGRWNSDLLFTYTIPSKLLFSSADRLYESLLPLVPWYGDTAIYYCSCISGTTTLGLYRYVLDTKKTETFAVQEHSLLSPYKLDNIVLCGGECDENDQGGIRSFYE